MRNNVLYHVYVECLLCTTLDRNSLLFRIKTSRFNIAENKKRVFLFCNYGFFPFFVNIPRHSMNLSTFKHVKVEASYTSHRRLWHGTICKVSHPD